MARPRPHRTRIALAIAGVLILIFVLGVAAAGGVFVGWHLNSRPSSEPTPSARQAAPSPPPPTASASAPGPTSLADDFEQLQGRLQGQIGLAIAPAGNGNAPWVFGDWQTGPAWSTIKVPLAIAAYRENPRVTDAMRAAITESDNAAAESIWQGLGEPAVAAQKVEAVLRQTGDDTVVQSQKVRPEFTAFGQTIWPLTEQAQVPLRRGLRRPERADPRIDGQDRGRPELGDRPNPRHADSRAAGGRRLPAVTWCARSDC